VVRNGFRQQANVPDEIFFKFNDIETFYEKCTIYKNNKQTKLINYFFSITFKVKNYIKLYYDFYFFFSILINYYF
jgi:hypothetical protein